MSLGTNRLRNIYPTSFPDRPCDKLLKSQRPVVESCLVDISQCVSLKQHVLPLSLQVKRNTWGMYANYKKILVLDDARSIHLKRVTKIILI